MGVILGLSQAADHISCTLAATHGELLRTRFLVGLGFSEWWVVWFPCWRPWMATSAFYYACFSLFPPLPLPCSDSLSSVSSLSRRDPWPFQNAADEVLWFWPPFLIFSYRNKLKSAKKSVRGKKRERGEICFSSRKAPVVCTLFCVSFLYWYG